MSTQINPIDAAAADFGRHTKGGGGWALGLAVASCVRRGSGSGSRKARNDRYELAKVSAQEFARRSGTSAPRVLRYLEAWDRAAEAELVPPADDLLPEDWNDAECIPDGYEWADFYEAGEHNGGGRVSADPDRAIAQIIEKHGVEAITQAVTRNEDVTKGVLDHVVRGVNEPHPNAGGGGGPLGPVLDELRKLLIAIGAPSYTHTGKKLYEALSLHLEQVPLRPREIEAIKNAIEEGVRYGQDSLALLTPVSDEDLAEFLSGEKG